MTLSTRTNSLQQPTLSSSSQLGEVTVLASAFAFSADSEDANTSYRAQPPPHLQIMNNGAPRETY